MSAAKRTPASSEVPAPNTLVHLDPAAILMSGNSRFSEEVPIAEAEQMRVSILEVGRIMEPVGVTVLSPPSDGGHTHQLRYGFRRVSGALLANAGGAGVMVPALILHDADESDTLKEQVTENVVRKSLSLMDMAASARKMLDAGMSRADVREIFKRPVNKGTVPASPAWLNMILGLLELPKAIQSRIHVGDIGLASAYRLMKAPAEKRAAILEAAEKSQADVRAMEEKEEKKFVQIETKIEEESKAVESAQTAMELAKAEVELAEKTVEEKQIAAQSLYQKEREAEQAISRAKGDDKKKAAKDALKKSVEARKAAEADAKAAETQRTAAQRALTKETDAADKHAKSVTELQAKLEAARAAKPAAGGKGKGAVSRKAIDKAAKDAGVTTGQKKLTGPEMRKVIEDLALVTSYPKVAALGQIIKECFDSTTTEGQMVKKLATLTGEAKAAARK